MCKNQRFDTYYDVEKNTDKHIKFSWRTVLRKLRKILWNFQKTLFGREKSTKKFVENFDETFLLTFPYQKDVWAFHVPQCCPGLWPVFRAHHGSEITWHVTLKVRTKVITKVNTKVRPERSRLIIDAGLPNDYRLQSLPQRSDVIDLTSATRRSEPPLGPKLWNV